MPNIIELSFKFHNFALQCLKYRIDMGRAFEYRKATKLKRWETWRVFYQVRQADFDRCARRRPDPDTNPRLRVLMQQAKKENMPKENVERAVKSDIKR